MATIFSKIIAGEIPSYKIYEDEKCFVFLDILPLKEGHTLVIPKEEVDYIFDLENDLYNHLWLVAKKIGHAIGKTIPCQRVGVAVVGLEVPHAHIHLVPLDHIGDIDFTKERVKLSPEEFTEIAVNIKANL